MHSVLCLEEHGKMNVKYINFKLFVRSLNNESRKNPTLV